jgi:hypothetical protein
MKIGLEHLLKLLTLFNLNISCKTILDANGTQKLYSHLGPLPWLECLFPLETVETIKITQMAEAFIDGIFTSDNQPQCFSAETNVNCANCILMKGQLHSALLELQTAETIISLLREDIKKATAPEATNLSKMSLLHGSSGYEQAGSKLIPVVNSFSKREKTPTVTSMITEHSYRSSDRFTPLNVKSEWTLVTTKITWLNQANVTQVQL